MAKKPVPLDNLDGDHDGAAGGTLPDGYRWATDEELAGLGLAADEQTILNADGDRVADTAEELRALLDGAPSEEPEAVAEEPEAVAEEPEAVAEEPEAVAEEPEAVAEEPDAPGEPAPPVDNDHVEEGATPFTPEDVAANAEPEALPPRQQDVVVTLQEIHTNATDPAVREALAELAVTLPENLTDQMRALGWATNDPDARIQLLAQADRLDL